MRIVFFHNWSWLGGALARALIRNGADDLLLVGAPAPLDERDNELRLFARASGVPLAAPRDIGSPAFLRRMVALQPDLILVGTFARKLPKSLLEIPRVAALNVHTSLLPAYRGALPEFWAIRNGERLTGVSVHHMNERFDAGAVLAQAPIDVFPDDDLMTLSSRLAHVAPPLVLELLARLRRGERPAGRAQDESRASRAPMPTEAHLTVDWRESRAGIDRLLRASRPFLDVTTRFRGERLILRRLERTERRDVRLAPGQLEWRPTLDRLFVGAADGPMDVEEIEDEGRALKGGAFARARKVGPGERFG